MTSDIISANLLRYSMDIFLSSLASARAEVVSIVFCVCSRSKMYASVIVVACFFINKDKCVGGSIGSKF